ELAISFVTAINRYAERRAPWKLAKSAEPQDRAALETSLSVMAESLRRAVGLLEPVMPAATAKVYQALGYASESPWLERIKPGDTLVGAAIGEKAILFPKSQPDKEA